MGFTIVWPEGAEESLEQEFNSLDAQREACTAYVASQKAEGWVVICKKKIAYRWIDFLRSTPLRLHRCILQPETTTLDPRPGQSGRV